MRALRLNRQKKQGDVGFREARSSFLSQPDEAGSTRRQTMRATPTITAFERSPDGGKGQARDMRVRWALEEVGQPYDVRLL
ncbi:MAG: hypothetical protein ACREUF_05410, partial [Solimonas sp.]